MKALRTTRYVLLAIAAALLGLSVIFALIIPSEYTSGSGASGSATVVVATSLTYLTLGYTIGAGVAVTLAVIGCIFLGMKNKVLYAIGVGFSVPVFLLPFGALGDGFAHISSLIAFIAAVVYAVSWIFCLIAYAVGHAKHDEVDPDSDPRIEAILKWKKYLDQKIITEEEFMERRNAILGIEKEAQEEQAKQE